MSNKFEIYKNYGVLANEKRAVYTYGAEHAYAACSDKLTVELPGNDLFSLYKNTAGQLMVEAAWGWCYDINEILSGNERPRFSAIDRDNVTHWVYLDVVEDAK